MSLQAVGTIALPPSKGEGGFDHAAVHRRLESAYIAHTSNHSLDVVDLRARGHSRTLEGFPGVAGVLISEARDLVFTSNRGESSVSFFQTGSEESVRTVAVGGHPNGLAYDSGRELLLAANVGRDGGRPGFSVSIVDSSKAESVADIPVPGRTRWAVFDPGSDRFYVNVRSPAEIIVVDPEDLSRAGEGFQIPSSGPHGMDLDPEHRRLFCACDGGRLCQVDLTSGRVTDVGRLSGSPDVVFYNSQLRHLYVAVGDPGVIDVFDTRTWARIETIPTEAGAGTLTFNPDTNEVGAVLQVSHRLALFRDA